VELAAEQQEKWPLRQHARLELPGMGVVEVFRSQEKLDLSRAENELAGLDRDYHELIVGFQERPEDEKCLDRLADRRAEQKANAKALDENRVAFRRLAPEGIGALETTLNKINEQRHLVLNRRAELAEWIPTDEEVEEEEKSFQARTSALQETRKKLEIAEKKAFEDKQSSENLYQERRGNSVSARTTVNNRSDELKRSGDEPTLQTALSEATKKRGAAQEHLNAAQLSESEKTIPQRLKDAQTAVGLRRERLNDLRGEIERHRGRLEASEGLHPKLSNAEAELEDAQKTLSRATLAANAHKRLRDLFEECRNSRVQCVMGPIEKRVLEWAESVGLREYRQFRFGDQFLPEGVIVRTDQTAQPRSLQEESYGIGEQLSLLVRLALGGVLAKGEQQVAILDDPLAHADRLKHERILELLRRASEGAVDSDPPAGPVQILILTCHPDRFDHLPGATQINLAERIIRET
jgi:hypothetical protein